MSPEALELLDGCGSAVQVIVLGRRRAVERAVSRLQRGLPLEVPVARPARPVKGRGRGDCTVAAHLDVLAA